jgi:hypothetical protein
MITAILFLTERELTQAKRNRFRNTEPEVESWQSIAIRSLVQVCLTLFLSLLTSAEVIIGIWIKLQLMSLLFIDALFPRHNLGIDTNRFG